MCKPTENFWNGLGWGIIWLNICLGVGGCEYLSEAGGTKRAEAEAKLILAKMAQNNIPTNNISTITLSTKEKR